MSVAFTSIEIALVPVTAYRQNCSVLKCAQTGRIAIVDPGGDTDRILAAVERLGGEARKILLTHGHMDHCAAADELRRHLRIPIEGPHEGDRFWIDKLPEWCQLANFPHADAFEPDRWLCGGDTVALGAQTLRVLHCPGHTPGHVVFVHDAERIAWVGDVIFQGAIGRTDFPRGNRDDLIASIRERLFPLGDDITFIPGHGPTSTFGHERHNNPFVADAR